MEFSKRLHKALENLKNHSKSTYDLTNESRFDKALDSDKVLESEENFKINDNVYLFEVDEESFLVKNG